MGLFSKGKLDTNACFKALTSGTYEDFDAVYDKAHIDADYGERTSLSLSLGNGDLKARVSIADRLLDDGADVTRGNPLHVLVAQNSHDFDAEAKLIQRMLNAGADVNLRTEDGMTPLEQAACNSSSATRP